MNQQFFVLKAELIATTAHYAVGQKRKYDGQDYIVHPREVFEKVQDLEPNNIVAQSIAWLHDVVEDTKVPIEFIQNEFGGEIAEGILDLTKYYTKEHFPALNRRERCEKEAKRMSQIKKSSKLVKLADIWSNTKDLAEKNKEFARIYLEEKIFMIDFIEDGNLDFAKELRNKLNVIVKNL